MTINSYSTAINTLTAAQHRVTNAHQKMTVTAQNLTNLSVSTQNDKGTNPRLISPALSLKEAELQNAAGLKVFEAEKNTLGYILNTVA